MFKFNYIYFSAIVSYLFYLIESISETTYAIPLCSNQLQNKVTHYC